MNLAFLVPAFRKNQKEASTITLLSLASALIDMGHKVIIISNREDDLPEHEIVENDIHIYRPYKFFDLKVRVGINPLFFFDLILAHALGVRKAEERFGIHFDIIHSFSASSLLMLRAILAKKLSKNKKVVLIHSFKSISQYMFGLFLVHFFSFFFKKIIVQSTYQYNLLRKKGVKDKKIIIVPSHINLHKFKPLNKNELKSRYGYLDKFVLMYYGHFLPEKGIEYLMKACSLIPMDQRPFYKCLLIGSGLGETNVYQKMIQQEDVSEVVEIIHPNVNIVEYINLSDLVVLPYPYLKSTEANPSCILESMACKTPVLTSDIPELTTFLSPNKNVFVAEPKNQDSIISKIKYIQDHQVIKEQVIEAAYQFSQKFGIDISAKRHNDIYDWILK